MDSSVKNLMNAFSVPFFRYVSNQYVGNEWLAFPIGERLTVFAFPIFVKRRDRVAVHRIDDREQV